MRRVVLSIALVLGSLSAACGDDPAAASSSSGGSSGGGADTTGTGQPSSGAGAIDEGSPHTPEAGCRDGFTACGDVCADTANDVRHCGECDQDCLVVGCGDGETGCGCVAGACVPGQACLYEPICDGLCVDPATHVNADHCGSCDNRCGDLALCLDNHCVEVDADGSSCARPIFWDEDEERVGFRMTEGNTAPHVFTCGPLDAIPTRWFRVTVNDEETRIEVAGSAGDDLIVEVFADDACDEAAQLACGDGSAGDEDVVELEGIAPGETFWVAVGAKTPPSGAPATFRVDR